MTAPRTENTSEGQEGVSKAIQDAEHLAYHLQGTPAHLETAAETYEVEDTQEMREHLDTLVFCCEVCEWWCERSEESYTQPGVCDDCADEEEDDD